jgi:phospho-N-acetylmuramoyl-pentapeptide-transferase
MLLLLIKLLKNFNIKVFYVFSYSSTRMILAAITSLILTIFLGPYFIKKLYSLKIGQPIRSGDECPVLANLHKKKKNTPTMGGLLILFSMVVSLILWMDFKSGFTWGLFFITICFGFLGGVDDYLKLKRKNSKGLRAKKKFLFQIFFASLVALYLVFPMTPLKKSKKFTPVAKEFVSKKGVKTLTSKEYISKIYIPFFKKPLIISSSFFIFLFIVFVIVGASNAVNLTDGLDGLAAGSLIMVSLVLALFAFVSSNLEMAKYLNILYIEKSSEIGIYLFALIGGALGFLWYNGYPAQVFMGDIGSLTLGAILGVSSVFLRREVLLGLAGGIFVVEALSVILQVLSYKYRNKKRIFLCAPLHHHFEYKGMAEPKVVLRFWIVGLFLAIISVASIKFQ